MRWPGWHRRVRKKLSPYLDAELSPGDQRQLEAHLAACEACRAELAELRAVRKALASMPLEKEPRSFALTPSMVERPSPSGSSALRRLETASRLAAAGLAVALAAVLLLDLRGGEEAGLGPAAAPRAAIERAAEGMEGLAPPEGGPLAEPSAGSTPSAPAIQDLQREAPPTPAATAAAAGEGEASDGLMVKTAAGAEAGGGGGPGTTVIGLAAGLGLAVATSGALTIARRRGRRGA